MTEVPLDQLADADDDLDWDVIRDGRMRDHATVTEDAEPITAPYTPDGE